MQRGKINSFNQTVMADERNEHGHDKPITIIVNAQEKTVTKKELTFSEVVVLAFPSPAGETTVYTVTYRRGGNEHKPEGTLSEGESVKIKDGTIFNVTATNKS